MPREYGRTQGYWPDGRLWKIQDYCIKMQGVQYSKSLKRWTNLKKQLPSEGIPPRSLPHTFKLVSWNLQHEERNFGERCATVVEYLQDILLDDDDDVITGRPVPFVLALQEIPKIQFGTILKVSIVYPFQLFFDGRTNLLTLRCRLYRFRGSKKGFPSFRKAHRHGPPAPPTAI